MTKKTVATPPLPPTPPVVEAAATVTPPVVEAAATVTPPVVEAAATVTPPVELPDGADEGIRVIHNVSKKEFIVSLDYYHQYSHTLTLVQ